MLTWSPRPPAHSCSVQGAFHMAALQSSLHPGTAGIHTHKHLPLPFHSTILCLSQQAVTFQPLTHGCPAVISLMGETGALFEQQQQQQRLCISQAAWSGGGGEEEGSRHLCVSQIILFMPILMNFLSNTPVKQLRQSVALFWEKHPICYKYNYKIYLLFK